MHPEMSLLRRFFAQQEIAKAAEPYTIARLIIELLEKCLTLRLRNLGPLARVAMVRERRRCRFHIFQDGGIAFADEIHLVFFEWHIAERRAPVRRPLKNKEILGGLCGNRNDLHASRASADDADPLAREIDRLRIALGVGRPAGRMM